MRTKLIFFRNILTIKINEIFYALTLLVFAVTVSALWLATNGNSAKAENAESLRGAAAVERLKKNGQYDSLLKAFNATHGEKQTGFSSSTAPETFLQTGKLFAPDGKPADFLGYSVALSGDTAIVGAPLSSLETGNPPLISQGAAYIFTRSGTSWTLEQKLLASDGATRDYFGASVSIEGNTAVIGAMFDDVGASVNQGSAYVFTRSGTVWTEQAKLTAAQGTANDRFGVSVEISNETVVAGTKREQGAAYVFTRSGTVWTQQQQLVPSNGAAGDEFGGSVAINLDTILVSATGRPVSGADNQGAVYVFTRSGGVWSEQQILTAADGAAEDRFGGDVAITGDTAIIGAPFDDITTKVDQGSAYVFNRSGASWTQQTKLLASDGAAGDHFGSTVSISGNTVVGGAPGDDVISGSFTYEDTGTAYVFTGSGAAWTLQRQISLSPGSLGIRPRSSFSAAISGETLVVGIPGANEERGYGGVYIRSGTSWSLQAFLADDDEEAATDGFGLSVAIEGDTAVIGAPLDKIAGIEAQGSAYVFVRSSATNAWTLQQKLTAADGAARHYFGGDVAISGDTIVVGNFYFFQGFPDSVSEAAYVFVRSGATWTQQQKLTASDGAAGNRFGASVGISGDTIVGGAPFNGAGSKGAAYIYTRSSGVWTERQKLFVENPGQNRTSYGYSVAASGSTIVVGAPRYGTGGVIYAYITADGGATWTLQQLIAAGDTNSCDALGLNVALSGDTVISSTNFGLYTGAGCTIQNGYKVYVFARSGTTWAQQQRIYASEASVSQVAISGDTAIFGVSVQSSNASNSQSGAVVFTRSGTIWTQRQTLNTADDATIDGATDVAVSGSTIIVGAPLDELDLTVNQEVDFTSHQGSAYIFTDAVNGTPFDFDGDGRADLSVFRPDEGNWYINRSSNNQFYGAQFGVSTDKLAPADYDGDGRMDIAVWRESEGNFYILNSSNNSLRVENFGLAGDVLSVGDYDGDGKADLSTYRDGTQSYIFYRGSNNNPNGNITYLKWGTTGDRSLRGDFDGDGKFDAVVFRPSNNTWYIRQSSDGQIRYETWGLATDRFVPADYDGDGKTDLAIFRNGVWYIKQSSNNQPRYETFGLASDLPVPADYDGDGRTDIAVFRNGLWYLLGSQQGFSAAQFGLSNDKPIPAAFSP